MIDDILDTVVQEIVSFDGISIIRHFLKYRVSIYYYQRFKCVLKIDRQAIYLSKSFILPSDNFDVCFDIDDNFDVSLIVQYIMVYYNEV